jgi:hypothetical protein
MSLGQLFQPQFCSPINGIAVPFVGRSQISGEPVPKHPIENPNRIYEYPGMTPENEKLVKVAMGYFQPGRLDEAVIELGPLAGHERLSVLSLWSAALRLSQRWPEMVSLSRKMIELYPAEAECW